MISKENKIIAYESFLDAKRAMEKFAEVLKESIKNDIADLFELELISSFKNEIKFIHKNRNWYIITFKEEIVDSLDLRSNIFELVEKYENQYDIEYHTLFVNEELIKGLTKDHIKIYG